MQWVLENQPNLDVKQMMVEKIKVQGECVTGIVGQTGAFYKTRAVIIATGTFLKSRIIIGDLAYSSGPSGNAPSIRLSDSLKELGFTLGRFKTGTPARVDKRSINFNKMNVQPGDEKLLNFSFI